MPATIRGTVTEIQKVYVSNLSVETFDTIIDPVVYLSEQLVHVKIALGITETSASVVSASQDSLTRRGDLRLYVFTVVITA